MLVKSCEQRMSVLMLCVHWGNEGNGVNTSLLYNGAYISYNVLQIHSLHEEVLNPFIVTPTKISSSFLELSSFCIVTTTRGNSGTLIPATLFVLRYSHSSHIVRYLVSRKCVWQIPLFFFTSHLRTKWNLNVMDVKEGLRLLLKTSKYLSCFLFP